MWDLLKYKWHTPLTFRLWFSKEQFPLNLGQMSLTQPCISSQDQANNSVGSIPHHTTQHEFNAIKSNSPTSLTVNKIWNMLEPGNADNEHELISKPFNKLATKTPWAATWNPETQQAFTPSTPMELCTRLMLVTETFVFKASASAWPKGKQHGSKLGLTSVPEWVQEFEQGWSSHVYLSANHMQQKYTNNIIYFENK